MKKELLSLTDKIILSVILLVAAILRLWDLGSVPFMHDEFSALSRTSYSSISDLLREGVMINDSHPAGVQIFLYLLVKIFGWNELFLKLPFTLMGIASVYLVFKIGQQWFNTNVGLISAAFFTISELFIFYSQLIRPYSPGLFFILLFVYFWNRLLFLDEKPSPSVCIGFVLSAFISSQIHNFSLAQAGLIWASGLLFLKKDNKTLTKTYLLCGVAALILFLPTSKIFYYQLFVRGGIGGWLSMPELSFVCDFLKYSLNYSHLLIFGSIIIILYPFLTNKINNDKRIGLRIAGIMWFIIPLTLAFVYSKMKEPILQFSTMIFSFPFLIIVLCSFYDKIRVSLSEKYIITGFILIAGITSLIIDRQYYKQVYNQGFDQIAAEMKTDMDHYGDSISFASFSNRSFMTKFYQDRECIRNNAFYDKNSNIYDYQDYISNNDSEYIGIGITDHASCYWEQFALIFYPNIVKEKQWFNSKYLLLSKDNIDNQPMTVMKKNVIIREGNEWGCSFVMKIDTIKNIDDIGFIAEIQSHDTIRNIILVVEIRDAESDSLLLWRGADTKGHVMTPGKTHYLSNNFHYDNKKYDKNNVKLKVYICNKDKKFVEIKRIMFYHSKKEPYFSGLYKPLK